MGLFSIWGPKGALSEKLAFKLRPEGGEEALCENLGEGALDRGTSIQRSWGREQAGLLKACGPGREERGWRVGGGLPKLQEARRSVWDKHLNQAFRCNFS